MDKVYIVIDGAYGENRIEAVFATLEEAEEYRELINPETEVEEWDVGKQYTRLDEGLGFYEVEINPTETNVRKLNPFNDDGGLLTERVIFTNWRIGGLLVGSWWFTLYARSEEQAVKIASERKATLIESGRAMEEFKRSKSDGGFYIDLCPYKGDENDKPA
ncbi:MAG: hypothetical protein ABFC56_13670 [Clostridiaceae bacterium]